MEIRVGIITVSDRSARGEREDESGPALASFVTGLGWQVSYHSVVADDFIELYDMLVAWTDVGELDLILTTGGTGFAPRDITPEVTQAVIDRNAPGLAEVMRQESLKITPHAMLSRAVAGIRKCTLIINLPGSPRAAVENIQQVVSVIPHAIQLLHQDPDSETGHKFLKSDG